MNKEYIVISVNGEDWEANIKYYTKEELNKWLKELQEYDEIEYTEFLNQGDDTIIDHPDGNRQYMIIKGKVVTPIPKKVITEYEIE